MPRLILIAAFAIAAVPAPVARAQTRADSAEARVYFKRGNALYEQATRSTGKRRTRLLERSLEAYTSSLRIVRSRNAIFNTAIVFEELGRLEDAFNYYTEYLAIEGIGEIDRREADRRRTTIVPRVALVNVVTEPAGATCWVDRMDVGPSGTTPLELALPSGKHQVLLRKDGYEPATVEVDAVRGERKPYEISLVPKSVELVIETEEPLSLMLDGKEIAAGVRVPVPAGKHDLQFGSQGNTFTKSIEVPVTDAPFVVKVVVPRGLLVVRTLPEAQIYLDDAVVGRGPRLELPVIAGKHRIDVVARTYVAQTKRIEIEERKRLELDFVLEKSQQVRLKRAALGTLAGAGATLAVATGLAIRARTVRDDYQRAAEAFRQDPTQENLRRARSLQDKTDRLNLAADIFWITTAAAGVTSLTLFLIKRRREKRAERPQVSVIPTRHGLHVAASVPLGRPQ